MFRYLRPLLFAALLPFLYFFWEWGAAKFVEDSVHAPVTVTAFLVGKPAPDVDVNKSQVWSKQNFSMRALKGKPVLVHFWATWCAPCVAELPQLLERAKSLRADGYIVVAVAVDESWGKIDSFFARYPALKDLPNQTTLLLDPRSEIAEKFGSTRFPESFLINDLLVIDNKLVGPQPWSAPQMDTYLKRLKH